MTNVCIFIDYIFFKAGERVNIILRILNKITELFCVKKTYKTQILVLQQSFFLSQKCLEKFIGKLRCLFDE